ncbi:beta-phosphoglucomutase family hydrolase [Cyclospora cayetanensis]|uniref:Beta-phosphoglucomutase family hydrolase n=1 Tax=Cyclospora cayetanensis TaxID=88456 RepID=A0A1D3CY13_9EIME|nr:beta-phosphoglucomutase family hydrolase [Cyclospora cayetanensis]
MPSSFFELLLPYHASHPAVARMTVAKRAKDPVANPPLKEAVFLAMARDSAAQQLPHHHKRRLQVQRQRHRRGLAFQEEAAQAAPGTPTRVSRILIAPEGAQQQLETLLLLHQQQHQEQRSCQQEQQNTREWHQNQCSSEALCLRRQHPREHDCPVEQELRQEEGRAERQTHQHHQLDVRRQQQGQLKPQQRFQLLTREPNGGVISAAGISCTDVGVSLSITPSERSETPKWVLEELKTSDTVFRQRVRAICARAVVEPSKVGSGSVPPCADASAAPASVSHPRLSNSSVPTCCCYRTCSGTGGALESAPSQRGHSRTLGIPELRLRAQEIEMGAATALETPNLLDEVQYVRYKLAEKALCIFLRMSSAFWVVWGACDLWGLEALACALSFFRLKDYDGTLTPIVADPREARMSAAFRATLKRLAAVFPVAIVTGQFGTGVAKKEATERDRSLARRGAERHGWQPGKMGSEETQRIDSYTVDALRARRRLETIRSFVRLSDAPGRRALMYAASHGFDIDAAGFGICLRHQVGEASVSALRSAVAEVLASVGPIKGLYVEDNYFSVSIHYRHCPEYRAVLEAALDRVLKGFPTLRKCLGLELFDIRIAAEWDKGTAISWILEAVGLNGHSKDLGVIYVGDDLTDEDAFRVVRSFPSGIPVVVSPRNRGTFATLHLDNVYEVRLFLEALIQFPCTSALEELKKGNMSIALKRLPQMDGLEGGHPQETSLGGTTRAVPPRRALSATPYDEEKKHKRRGRRQDRLQQKPAFAPAFGEAAAPARRRERACMREVQSDGGTGCSSAVTSDYDSSSSASGASRGVGEPLPDEEALDIPCRNWWSSLGGSNNLCIVSS